MTERRPSGKGQFDLYPHLLFEIFCIFLIITEIVIALALLLPPPVRRQIDFAFQFSPKPAWYFLPLYELVKFFPGKLLFLGASLLPLLLLLLLYAVPWLDSGPERNITGRKVPALCALALALAILWLLYRSTTV